MKFSEIKYERPDFEAEKEASRKFVQAFKNAKSYKEARKLFLDNEKSGEHLSSMEEIAYIRNTIDTRDEFYDGEMNVFYEEMPKLQIVFNDENEALLNSPFKDDFAKEFGNDLIKNIEAGFRLTDEKIVQDRVEESKLCQKYSKTVAACTTEFHGENCNFYGLLKFMQSTDKKVRKEAFLAWSDLYKSVSDELDDIYLKLVALRKSMAKKLGFKSFIDMAYLANGHYYYGLKDVEAFRKQVVEEIVPVAAKLYEEQCKRLGIDKLHYYDEQLIYPEGNAVPIGDEKKLVQSALEMYRELSKETGEFFEFMVENELFDLTTKPGKHMGGYCTCISEYKYPFIFSNFNGTSADVDVLTHEAGHAFAAFTSVKNVPLSSQIFSTSEISEIHSMSMEHFTYPWMDKFFGDKSDKYRYAHLSEALKVVPYLCLVDHFQTEVYKHDYNAKELRACWRRLEKIYMPWRDYDGNEFLEEGGFWMQKQHIFLSPFYYIDYALAQMGAFEYYTKSKHDKKKAWNDYYKLCQAGGSKSYFELLELGGLSNPFEKGSVKRAIAGVIEELL